MGSAGAIVLRSARRLPAHQRIQRTQRAVAATGRRNQFNLGGTTRGSQTIAFLRREPKCQRRQSRGLHRFEAATGTERHRCGAVVDHRRGALAFGLEQLGMRAAGACRDAPIDVAHIIPGCVQPGFGVFHAAPPKRRLLRTGKIIGTAPSGQHREPADLRTQPDQFAQVHLDSGDCLGMHRWVQGTGMRSSSALITSSLLAPSASASKDSRTRWRNTSSATACTSCGAT